MVGSPINVGGGSTPSSHFSPHLGLVVNFCEMKDKYKYIAIYVDDLLIASDEPQKIIQDLKDKFKLKNKGHGPLEYHLGCDYKLDKDGTLVAQPTKYIYKINRKIYMIFPLVSCCSCVNNPSSS